MKNSRLCLFRYLGTARNDGHHHQYYKPSLSSIPMTVAAKSLSSEATVRLENLKLQPFYSAILADVGRAYYDGMLDKVRLPIPLEKISLEGVHEQLASIGPGVLDMKIKNSGEDDLILPIEFESLRAVLETVAGYEKCLNKDYADWNMWLLVDRRDTKAATSQRNAGAHCDDFTMRDPTLPQTSIYIMSNKLPTEVTHQVFSVNGTFDPNRDNYNTLVQRDWVEKLATTAAPHVLYRMDGHTPHRAAISEDELNDRMFIRIYFTPKHKELSRLGNTANPCLKYPDNYWKPVPDVASQLANTVEFKEPWQFNNMWDNACLGHPSYSIQGSGKWSHEALLINKIKSCDYPLQMAVIKDYQQRIEKLRSEGKRTIADLYEDKLYLLKYHIYGEAEIRHNAASLPSKKSPERSRL